jgi:long-chain fatty acid transport protein
MNRPTLHLSTFLLIAALSACGIWAADAGATEGTQLIGIGALQKGTGGAGVASPKDMTWVLLNPASIIDSGCRIDVNLEVFAPYRTNEPHGIFGFNGQGEMTDDSIFFIPSMGFSRCSPSQKVAFGFGLYGVSGMGVEYERARTILPPLFFQNYDRRTEYSVAKLAFAGAYRFENGWTVGFAPHLNYARFQSDMLTLNFAQTQGDNDWDDAFGLGFSVGVYKVWDRWSFGAVYNSRQWFERFSDYEDLFFASMDIPQSVQVGVAYDITPNLEAVFDLKWIDWDGVDQVGVEPIRGGFGWEDQHIVKGGLTWTINDKWKVRGGVSYGESPIDEGHVFANALFPAVTEMHAAAGFSYALTEKSDIHFTYMHAFDNHLKDRGYGEPFSVLGRDTEISLRENTFTIEYSYKLRPLTSKRPRGKSEAAES